MVLNILHLNVVHNDKKGKLSVTANSQGGEMKHESNNLKEI